MALYSGFDVTHEDLQTRPEGAERVDKVLGVAVGPMHVNVLHHRVLY